MFDIELDVDILRRNRELADENRRILDEHDIVAVDVMGSVAAGKTSLIVQLTRLLKGKHRIAAFAGDTTTTIDAELIEEAGADVLEINTGKECHLDANLVRKALQSIDLDQFDVLLIENVGNIICPADFPLGSHKRLVVISLTDGPYVVMKHPFVFQDAEVAVINKVDLAQATGISPDKLETQLLEVKPSLKVVRMNSLTGEGAARLASALDL
ncbi:MAG: hydrogenase nickel incorporation protein HypB [Dehalococcoidia bacterium]|nr:hydrogenase nickel incorporation protein HypB [Dehalococcoidia bacterium]